MACSRLAAAPSAGPAAARARSPASSPAPAFSRVPAARRTCPLFPVSPSPRRAFLARFGALVTVSLLPSPQDTREAGCQLGAGRQRPPWPSARPRRRRWRTWTAARPRRSSPSSSSITTTALPTTCARYTAFLCLGHVPFFRIVLFCDLCMRYPC